MAGEKLNIKIYARRFGHKMLISNEDLSKYRLKVEYINTEMGMWKANSIVQDEDEESRWIEYDEERKMFKIEPIKKVIH